MPKSSTNKVSALDVEPVKPKTSSISNVPPSITPPDIDIVPSELIVALKPAALKPSNKSPNVLVELNVIVLVSLFEFVTTTVSPSCISTPSPKSDIKVSSVARVTSVTTVSYCKSPLVWVLFEILTSKPNASKMFVVPSLVISASRNVKTPSDKLASIP